MIFYAYTPKLIVYLCFQLELINEPNSFDVFPGSNETAVTENYKSKSNWDPSAIFSRSTSVIDFPAFSPYCVGIYTNEKYSFHLKVRSK